MGGRNVYTLFGVWCRVGFCAQDRDATDIVAAALYRKCPTAFEEAGPADRRQHQAVGFTNPVLISDDGEIIAGHGRVMAAAQLGLGEVPTLKLSHLSAGERRAYVLADNKLALNAGWDTEILAIELQALIDLDFDGSVTGFSLADADLALDQARESAPDAAEGSDLVCNGWRGQGQAARATGTKGRQFQGSNAAKSVFL